MHPDLDHLLASARAARRAGSDGDALELLARAHKQATEQGDPAAERLVAWRLAKASFDVGNLTDLHRAVDVVLDHPAPLEHYPPAVLAVEPICRRLQDQDGYLDARVPQLWAAYRAHHRALGDPWLEAQGAIQLAWFHACRWDRPALRNLSESYLALSPGRFGRGPTKHPDAPDTTLSVYWVHAELGRIRLRAATWVGDQKFGADALDVLLDAMSAANRRPERDPWTVDAWCRAAERFEWPRAPWAEWSNVLEGWQEPHPAHYRLGRATQKRRDGLDAAADFLDAGHTALELRSGFEWVVDGLQESLRCTEDIAVRTELAQVRERTGVGIAVG